MNTDNTFQSAKDMMDKNIVFVDGLSTAKEAVEIMRENGVDSVIIKKRNEQDAYGIVSVQDIVKGVIIAQRESKDVNLFEIMTKPLITIPASMDVRYAARLLLHVDLWRAPVEEDGEYIGMISLSTITLNNQMV